MSGYIPIPSGTVPPWETPKPESKPPMDSTGFCLPIGSPCPKPLRMASDNKEVGYRSIATIREMHNKYAFIYPGDFPLQPFYEYEILIKALKRWSIKYGFGTTTNGSEKASGKRGIRKRIVCHCWGPPRSSKTKTANNRNVTGSTKTGCPWAIYVEEVQNPAGEIVFMVTASAKTIIDRTKSLKDDDSKYLQDQHNHPLVEDDSEKMASKSFRYIPEELYTFADNLADARMMPSKIYRALAEKCFNMGLAITFTRDDVRNRYPTIGKSLDCSNAVQYLQERNNENPDLLYNYEVDADGTLSRIFFVMEGSSSVWNNLGEDTVLLFDTKHGTNRYGHKLGCFCTVDGEGRTRVLAATFLLNENEESFAWAFSKFASVFSKPATIFTDQDLAMDQALKVEWPNTVHVLCSFHIWKNFYKHIKPLFAAKGAGKKFSVVAGKFWSLCKCSDYHGQIGFSDEFDKLVSYISSNSSTFDGNDKAKNWLANLKEIREQWAGCWTWSHTSFGIHSTQRSEAANSAISTFCSKSSTLLLIIRDLEQLAATTKIEAELSSVRYQLLGDSVETGNSMAVFLVDGMTKWGRNNVFGQMKQCGCYVIEQSPMEEGTSPVEEVIDVGNKQYRIQRSGEKKGHSDTIPEDEKQLRDLERALDHGVSNVSFSSHMTSLRECSCQYWSCFKLPCRHQLFLAIFLGNNRALWEILKEAISAFWYIQGGSENSRSTETQLTSDGVRIRTKADRNRDLLAVSKQLSDIACQTNSTTLKVENALADLLSELKVGKRTLPIANPLLKKDKQKRKEPAPGNPTSSASKKTGRVHEQRRKQTNIANNAAMTGHHV